MDRTIILLAIFVLLGVSAFGQQDSLIVGNVYIDSGTTSAFVPVYGVVFDSVYSYSMTLGIRADSDTIGNITDVTYFPPLTNWNIISDTILQDPPRIRMLGWAPDHNPVYTQGRRLWLWVFRVALENDLPPQVAMIDTFGAFAFGNNTAFIPGYIYIGSPQGSTSENIEPLSLSLSQNYPNPFNAQTTISYSLAESGPAILTIYNLLGQKVTTLFDGIQAAGEHKVVWDATMMKSGEYFARLETGSDDAKLIRMLLLK